ncbi:MAG: GNAT family N-acetyltransferase [Clostridia bacterium]|nr:GNAT family N-acetyltransferase [Clostridia bacterium]
MIREAKIGDFEEMLEIVKEIQTQHYGARPDVFKDVAEPLQREEFEKLLNDEDSRVFVKEADGGIAAYCILKVNEFKGGHIMKPAIYLHINDFAVKEAYWRKGIGRELFNHAKAFAVDSGVESIQLMVWEFNRRALKFYEALGLDTMFRRMELKL